MKLFLIDDFFSRRPIAGQLVILRNLLIGGFLGLGLVYAVAVGFQMWFISYNGDITAFRESALHIESQMRQARGDEKDFMLLKQAAYIDRHKQTIKGLLQTLSETLDSAPDEQSRDLLLQLEKAIRKYSDAFLKVASAQVNLGLDENSGVHSVLRDAVHNVESEVKAANDSALLASMLMMRRHEKDFIQRIDEQYLHHMTAERARFDAMLPKSRLTPAQKSKIAAYMTEYHNSFQQMFEGMMLVQTEIEGARNEVRDAEPLLLKLQNESRDRAATANELVRAALYFINAAYAVILLVVAATIAVGLFVVSRSISNPLGRMVETINRLAAGDDSARAKITARNEFGHLGAAFDKMMDERVATQNKIQRENDQLNESVLNLLQAVAQLSKRDLTVKVPVTEDVTGSVADALNLLTSETGKVLMEVSNISADVTSASMKVKEQADTVQQVARVSRREVEQTAESLTTAANAMNQIAELAQACNVSADNAIKTTQEALKAVSDTAGGINNTRDTIRETEKRIKRLGERSQEISGAVNLINTIAERTHILALNASMHAASAGEAGRGFAVVADEVQRLAENARQATAQIASLVKNIQVETSDTVNTMNAAITQVVEGAKLAEQASERMHQSEARTADLVTLVQRIAVDSTQQAKASNELLLRAAGIRKTSEETSQKIEEATKYSNNLVEYARSLLGTVRVFKLPG